jgi:hypothetical protein
MERSETRELMDEGEILMPGFRYEGVRDPHAAQWEIFLALVTRITPPAMRATRVWSHL